MSKIEPVSRDLRRLLVLTPNLHWHYSGVTSTIVALAPHVEALGPIAAAGSDMPETVARIPFSQVLRFGWSKPPLGDHRVWHARRNNEMIVGLALKWLLRQKWKLVFTWAGQRRQSWLTRWLERRMDMVIATSEGGAAYLGDIPHVVIHHGIDLVHFRPLDDRAAAWREKGLPGSFGIGAFGRMRHQKGTDLMVEAGLRLLPKYPEATMLLAGRTTPKHAAFVEGLKARVAAAGLERRILFLGEIPREKINEWFGLSSLYVAPMRSEGFGLTPLEAMACGTAVVATRTGAAAQLVADGETGLLVPPDDLDALTTAIESLLSQPERARTMGARGREKAQTQHDVATEARRIVDVYEMVLGFRFTEADA